MENKSLNLTQFKTTIRAPHTLAMEEQMDNYDFGLKEANVKNPKKTIDNVTKSIKCNQCTVVTKGLFKKSIFP